MCHHALIDSIGYVLYNCMYTCNPLAHVRYDMGEVDLHVDALFSSTKAEKGVSPWATSDCREPDLWCLGYGTCLPFAKHVFAPLVCFMLRARAWMCHVGRNEVALAFWAWACLRPFGSVNGAWRLPFVLGLLVRLWNWEALEG